MFLWTAPAVDRLKALWAEGHSAPAIARELASAFGGDLSRSAVIGKAHRLQLFRRVTTQRDKRQYKRKPATSAFNPPVTPKPAKKPSALALDTRAPRPVEIIPEAQRVALLDLEVHHCRFPFGDSPITFCGRQRVPGLAYCHSHARTCFATSEVFREVSKNPERQSSEKVGELEGVE